MVGPRADRPPPPQDGMVATDIRLVEPVIDSSIDRKIISFTTSAEGRRLLVSHEAELKRINHKLATHKHVDERGNPQGSPGYEEWYRKTTYARLQKEKEIGCIKEWVAYFKAAEANARGGQNVEALVERAKMAVYDVGDVLRAVVEELNRTQADLRQERERNERLEFQLEDCRRRVRA